MIGEEKEQEEETDKDVNAMRVGEIDPKHIRFDAKDVERLSNDQHHELIHKAE